MKNILVPCDFSEKSREAYRTALQFVSKFQSQIKLLYVLPLPTLYDTGIGGEVMAFDSNLLRTMEEDGQKELEKMKSEAGPRAKYVSVEVAMGDFIYKIKDAVEQNNFDLIIMGTSGTSGFSEMFIGSNTEKVVRHATVPVLAVKKAFELSSIKNILLPTNLNLDQTYFVNQVKEMQTHFKATLHVLLVNTPLHFYRDADALAGLAEYAKHYKLTNYRLHFRNHRTEEEGIADFVFEEKMDLIAMGTHARKGLAHLFNTSVTEDVVNHIQIPIWTCHLHQDAKRNSPTVESHGKTKTRAKEATTIS